MRTPRRRIKYVHAYVTPEDHARVVGLAAADQLSVAGFIRGLINDALEELGQPILASIRRPGPPKGTPSPLRGRPRTAPVRPSGGSA